MNLQKQFHIWKKSIAQQRVAESEYSSTAVTIILNTLFQLDHLMADHCRTS